MLGSLATDFIKNKRVKLFLLVGAIGDMLYFHSVYHILILGGLPYLTSLILSYFIHTPTPIKSPLRISEQFRPQAIDKIKITPR